MNILTLSSLTLALFASCVSAQTDKVVPQKADKQVKNDTAKKVVADFKTDSTSLTWKTVNDSVMGGISKGDSYITEASHLYFKGKISLENNGGFSSIRTAGSKHDLSGYTGMEIRVKGDGRMYYLTSRMNGKRMLAYWCPVQTKKGEWMTVKVPFKSFYATSFGRTIPGLRLNPKNITSFGFMLYDKKDGEFALEVSDIKAYK